MAAVRLRIPALRMQNTNAAGLSRPLEFLTSVSFRISNIADVLRAYLLGDNLKRHHSASKRAPKVNNRAQKSVCPLLFPAATID